MARVAPKFKQQDRKEGAVDAADLLSSFSPPIRRQATPDQTLLRLRAGRYERWRRPPLRTRKSCATGLTTRSCGSSGRCEIEARGHPCLRRLEFFVGERFFKISLNDNAWHGCLLRSSNIHYQGRSWKAPWESTTQRNSISSGPVRLGGCGRHPRRRRHRRPQRPRGQYACAMMISFCRRVADAAVKASAARRRACSTRPARRCRRAASLSA